MPRDGRVGAAGLVTAYRTAVIVFAVTFVALGVTMIVLTALRGGGVGFLIGSIFVALGIGRAWLVRRRPE